MNRLNRRAFLLGLAAAAMPTPSFAMRRPRVLFVCQAGTVKSPVARELLRKRAYERGIAVDVRSRGIAPADHMTPQIRERLIAEFGIDPAGEPAKTLHQSDLDRADVAVLFDALPPNLHKAGALDWTDQPSLLGQFDGSMAYLSAHIDALLDRLAKPPA